MTASLLESKAAFARRLGVNKSTITRAAQAGRLVLRGRLVDVAASLERWHATQGSRPDMAAHHATRRGQPIPAPCQNRVNGDLSASTTDPHLPPGNDCETALQSDTALLKGIQDATGTVHIQDVPETGEESAHQRDYHIARLRLENATIALNMALNSGLRHLREAVRDEAYALGAALQSGLERLIDQTAPRLAASRDQATRRTLLQRECAALAANLKTEFERSARRLRDSGGRG